MPNKNPLSKFWQELKRRKVIYVVTVYASAAYIIIELVNNVAEPLNLPERTPTVTIIILAIGFPIAVILSWIFDLTQKGMERTKPLSEGQEAEMSVTQNRWKIATYVSIAIIIGLIILNLAGRSTKLKAGDIQSLVVLPFDNFTGDDGLEYFVEGMHSSLIGDMGRISGLRVIGKTSSNIYKGVDMAVPEIAAELDVDAVVEASVLCLGDSICLQVRVLSTYPEEKQLWIADYKEERSQILNLYNQVTRQIADEAKVSLTPKEESLLTETRTVDKEAYDAFLKARYYWSQLDEEGLNKALEYYNLAMEKDPSWAFSYAGLAEYWVGLKQMGFIPPSVADPLIHQYINKALDMDPNAAYVRYVYALVAVWTDWDWEKGETEFLEVLKIIPNDAYCRIYYSHLLMCLGRMDEALTEGQIAMDLDPLNPLIQTLYAAVLLEKGDFEAGTALTENALLADPDNHFASWIHSLDTYFNGDYDKSFAALKNTLHLEAEVMANIEQTYREEGNLAAIEMIVNMLEEMALESYILPYDIASKYLMINKHDKVLEWLLKGYNIHDPNMPYVAADYADYEPLKNNPRFIELLKNMNLTWE